MQRLDYLRSSLTLISTGQFRSCDQCPFQRRCCGFIGLGPACCRCIVGLSRTRQRSGFRERRPDVLGQFRPGFHGFLFGRGPKTRSGFEIAKIVRQSRHLGRGRGAQRIATIVVGMNQSPQELTSGPFLSILERQLGHHLQTARVFTPGVGDRKVVAARQFVLTERSRHIRREQHHRHQIAMRCRQPLHDRFGLVQPAAIEQKASERDIGGR